MSVEGISPVDGARSFQRPVPAEPIQTTSPEVAAILNALGGNVKSHGALRSNFLGGGYAGEGHQLDFSA